MGYSDKERHNSMLQTQVAILESNLNAKNDKIGHLEREIERLKDLHNETLRQWLESSAPRLDESLRHKIKNVHGKEE